MRRKLIQNQQREVISMTMDQIRTSEKEFLNAEEIAEAIGIHPQSLRQQAHSDPAMLGFPVCVIGRRVLIPRKGFINFMEGGTT